jgi:hypothetical protein
MMQIWFQRLARLTRVARRIIRDNNALQLEGTSALGGVGKSRELKT